MNVDQKSLETEFLIAICRLTGNKWQLKTLFQAIFDPFWSIVKSIFDCDLPCVNKETSKFRICLTFVLLNLNLSLF